MLTTRRFWGLLAAALLVLAGLSGSAAAQGPDQLVLGQPVSVTLATAGETASLGYSVAEGRAVTLLAISQTVPPTLAVVRDGKPVAALENAEGALSITLNAYLPAGDYTVEVGGVNGGTGDVVVLVQTETPVTPTPLVTGSPASGTLGTQSPFAVYTFTALSEPAYLYADSLLPETGLHFRVLNVTTGDVSADLSGDLPGARLTIPAGTAEYQLEMTYGEPGADQPFTLCFSPIGADSCAGGATVPPTGEPSPVPASACVVTPAGGGSVNIRQTISVDSSIVTVLPSGASADVTGVSPDSAWFQVSYSGMTGWAAMSVLVATGDCATLPIVTPPAIPAGQPMPTAVPTNAPTAAPTMPPSAPPTAAPTATPMPSGPCVVSFTADELYYTQPEALPDYIFDQIMAGGELIMVGRWDANPSWYKTSSGMWWPNAVGTAGILSGGCSSLPMVSWP
ncbi:MAG TPA: SH3 domain-containing protein [Aggregatilinea sp.]|uniref:SH3 domain-containing protein n=1 Tax=Aggregatilinea sp. TaxID=2806333 RepID=UPI002BFFB45C|nr:SH3 domain-containing protein [Aggregatilinea sp.]HML21945.1 SH3 domain-containing protein [Aggregatilinea sp.]